MISFILHKLKLKLKLFVVSYSAFIIFLFDNFSYHNKNGDLQSYEKYYICFKILFTKNIVIIKMSK